MKSLLELDQFDLESASQKQVAEIVQALLEQVKKDAVLLQSNQAEIQSKDDKIQALTVELLSVTALALRRLRQLPNHSLKPHQSVSRMLTPC